MKHLLYTIAFFATLGCVQQKDNQAFRQEVDTLKTLNEIFETQDTGALVQALRVIPGQSWSLWSPRSDSAWNGLSQNYIAGQQRLLTFDSLRYQFINDSTVRAFALDNDTVYQTLTYSNDTLYISDGNSVVISAGRNTYNLVETDSMIVGQTYPVNSIIVTSDLSQTYKVQSDSIPGYNVDSIAVIPLNSGYAVLQSQHEGLDATHMGLSSSSSDNSNSFLSCLSYSKAVGSNIIIPEGSYRFNTFIQILDGNYNYDIAGNGNVIFEIYSDKLLQLRNKVLDDFTISSIQYNNSKDSLQFYIDSASQLAPGDLIAIESAETVPGVTNKEAVLIEVDKVLSDTSVLITDSILFDVSTIDTVSALRAFKNHSFTLKNISFSLKYDYETTGSAIIDLWGFNDVTLLNLSFVNDSIESRLADGFSLYGCKNVLIDNTSYKGLRYGGLANNSTNLYMVNARIYDCRHLFALNTWCTDVYVTKVEAEDCQTPIESHVAYNVHYDNIISNQHGKINLRGFGRLTITNCNISTDNTENLETTYTLIGYHFASDDLDGTEYERLIQNTNIEILNTKYYEDDPGQFTGLTATGFKNLIINNCVAHNMGGYLNANVEGGSLKISNSKTGMLQLTNVATSDVFISNTILDGSLSPTGYLIAKSTAPRTFFNNVKIVDSGNKYLLSSWVGDGNPGDKDINFYNLDGEILGISSSFVASSNPNHQINLYNSNLTVTGQPSTQICFGGTIKEFIKRNSSVVTFTDQTVFDSYAFQNESVEFRPYTGSNQRSRIDTSGLWFQRSASADYLAGVSGAAPDGSSFDNDLYLFSSDRIQFTDHLNNIRAYLNSIRWEMYKPVLMRGVEPDITSHANEYLSFRAGDGIAGRTAWLRFLVQNDLQALVLRHDLSAHFGGDSIVVNGLNIISGTIVPTASMGSQGSLYMRDDNDSTLYTKTATGWTLIN